VQEASRTEGMSLNAGGRRHLMRFLDALARWHGHWPSSKRVHHSQPVLPLTGSSQRAPTDALVRVGAVATESDRMVDRTPKCLIPPRIAKLIWARFCTRCVRCFGRAVSSDSTGKRVQDEFRG